VREAYEASRKTYGYRRIAIWIQKNKGVSINHKAVLRLMKKMNIRSVARKGKAFKRPKSTDQYHRYENILDRDFTASRPNEKWVTDITYITTRQGWAYLSVIKDLFDSFIVGHRISLDSSTELVLDTLKDAKKKEEITQGLLLHSDQGFQYTSHAYFDLTKKYHISPSMSRRGNCWDNASMENFFGHFKEEALRQFPTPTFEEAKKIVDDYIYFYNYERIQLKTKQAPYQTRCLSR